MSLQWRFLDHAPSNSLAPEEIGIADISKVNWAAVALAWAESASQRVLMGADKPSLENIQTCQVLAIFWFSRGETQRTNIHTSELLK